MNNLRISFMEQNDIQQSAKVLSVAMLNNPNHIGIFLGNGENVRSEIEKMFFGLFHNLPGIVFLAKENEKIIGVMRMKSCIGQSIDCLRNGQSAIRSNSIGISARLVCCQPIKD